MILSVHCINNLFPCFFLFRFNTGIAGLGNSGLGSAGLGNTAIPTGTTVPTSIANENTNPASGTGETGHQQFVQQMLQALAGANAQVKELINFQFRKEL